MSSPVSVRKAAKVFSAFSATIVIFGITLPQRPRKDEGFHAGHRTSLLLSSRHPLEGAASDEDGIELGEDGAKLDIWIHDDPVRLTFGTGDIAVQTRRP